MNQRYKCDTYFFFEHWKSLINQVYGGILWKNEADMKEAQALCCDGIVCNNRTSVFASLDLVDIEESGFVSGVTVWVKVGLDQGFVESDV